MPVQLRIAAWSENRPRQTPPVLKVMHRPAVLNWSVVSDLRPTAGRMSISGSSVRTLRIRRTTDSVDFDSLMLVAPRPQLIISSEQEFYRHQVLPKCLKALHVYLNWRDAEGLPGALAARQHRIGYEQTLQYYESQRRIAPGLSRDAERARCRRLLLLVLLPEEGMVFRALPDGLLLRGLTDGWDARWTDADVAPQRQVSRFNDAAHFGSPEP